jgi:acid phosphatase family membrane protein YuiD
MNYLIAIISNKIIIGTTLAVLAAQFLKIITNFIQTGTIDYSFMFSSSGMPSGHSAGIVSMTTLIGFSQGFDSAIFALSVGMAIVIMYDAMGVRRQAGKHATMLNYLLDKYTIYNSETEDTQHYLPERIGHTPTQVVSGALVGIICATAFFFIVGL